LSAPDLTAYQALAERRPASQHVGAAPRVSIITVCLNARATIARTIDSVQMQTFGDIEHIIVDGGSTDGTLDTVVDRVRTGDFG